MSKRIILLFVFNAILPINLKAQSRDSISNRQETGQEIYTALKHPPTFPGGANAFYSFLQNNISYPVSLKESGIQGNVVLVFIIEKDGKLSNFRVISSPSPELSKESLRVMSSSPTWNPGTQDGKPVRFLFKLPVKFALSTKTHPKQR